ncbi:MBL fold metallo-hydrolase [Defluviimonas salinarum]|uniref:MBL fold metallo-hydrolase n=1 Tax=Defluviimonas salinarum TaxID=2992147 RepID=A0ABT3J4U6_9RHOB|nr:MBL fold metallo-hydrolase [Defluviimonas salinarum]MCW3782697.1 MBL fold metallo-hydrolase [Defluviimonas salinarum]
MSLLVQPRLINDPCGDPGLYLDFRFGRRAMLFDLGDTAPLSPRELLRVSHVFVSHAHMDHIAGLERLLRLRLHRPLPLHLLGPAGFVGQMESRFGSYTWNLLDETSVDFRVTVHDFEGGRITRAAEFCARRRFRRCDVAVPDLSTGLVLSEREFEIRAVALDHGIPSLGIAFRQRLRVNVWRSALDELGLPVGPWIDIAKRALRDGLPDRHRIAVPGAGEVPLGLLRARVFRREKEQHFAYVTDAADTADNRARIVELARGADHLFIEAVFPEADRSFATTSRHLTARAAGEIARAAGVAGLTPFHHSARYADAAAALAAEALAAYATG